MLITVRQRIAMLLDSFEEITSSAAAGDPIGFTGYPSQVLEAQSASGESESVVIGIGQIDGYILVAALFEFEFLGGSMGEAAGAKLVEAMRIAGERGVPFLAVISTGGARLQEGMAALAQMPRTVAASMELARRGVLRISVLAQPTTGGVYASFASLADVIVAERDATIGFAGPRVAEAVTGHRLEAESHTAQAALEHGLIDAVVPAEKTRGEIVAILSAISPAVGDPRPSLRTTALPPFAYSSPAVSRAPHGDLGPPTAGPETTAFEPPPPGAWVEFGLARHPERPTPSQLIVRIFSEIYWLHGDRAGGVDPAAPFGFARLGDNPLVVVAFDRARPTAAGFRQARRAVELSQRLRLPLVTFIDTPGADPSFASEYSGLAGEIARTYEAILSVATPVICVVTGEGGSGGALALACADVVAMLQHAVFSVISPEGAAAIWRRDASKGSDVAEELKPTSSHLLKMGLVNHVIEEPGEGAHADPQGAARALGDWLRWAVGNTQADTGLRAARFGDPFGKI